MITHLYSNEYDPPAPVVEVVIVAAKRMGVEALVDSGADVTLIPISLLEQIGARYSHTHRLRGVIGAYEPVDIFFVSVEIASQTIRGIRAVAAQTDNETILGRDVLNQLVVTLHGPAEVVEIESALHSS